MLYATKRLIDSVWTVAYEMEGDKVCICGYGRECQHGYTKERELPRCRLVVKDGDKSRTVVRLVLSPFAQFRPLASTEHEGTEGYDVVNPQYVFAYGAPPEPE